MFYSYEDLNILAKQALVQIEKLHYDEELKMHHIQQVIQFGVAFSGKNVCVISE